MNKSFIISNINRIEYIDIAKGLGMILVVLGHCINSKTFPGIWISAFHMPLFFILSGLCFSEKKYPTFIPFLKKRIKTLLLPCIYFSFIVTTLIFFLLKPTAFHDLTKNLPGALWFVLVLFFTEILYYYISRISLKNKLLRLILLILMLFLGLWLSRKEILLPFSLSTIPMACFYYGIGHSYKTLINGIIIRSGFKLKIIFSFILIIVPGIITFLSKETIGMNINHFPQPEIIYLIISISGSLGILFLSSLNLEHAKRILLYIGRNTFIILSIHMLFISLSSQYISPFINNYVIYKIIEQIFIWLCLFISIKFINAKASWLIGK